MISVFRGGVAAMAVISLGLNVGLFAVYQANRINNSYGSSYVEWDSVWFGWGIVTDTWLVYMLILGVVASVGAATSAKGHSLTLQLVDVE
jgi:hypothetical protein